MSRSGRRRGGATVLAVTAALTSALAACSAGDSVQVRATGTPPSSPAATSTSATPATTSAATTPSTSATATTSGSSVTATSATTSTPTPSTSATTTAGSTTTTTTAAATRWPKALGEPQQGQPAWGVYLAVGHASDDAEIEEAVRQAAQVGYSAVVGDIACDGGAMEALKLDEFDYWTGATLYFRTQAEARTFAASYTAEVAKPKGVVKVKVGCLD